MKSWHWLALVVALIAIPEAAPRADPIELEPASDWVVNYAEDSCSLHRSFGDPGQPVHLEMRQFAPRQAGFQMMIATSRYSLPRPAQRARDPNLRYLPDIDRRWPGRGKEVRFEAGVRGLTLHSDFYPPELVQALLRGAADQARLEEFDLDARASSIEGIEVSDVFRRDLLLKTGSLGPPMRAMETCLQELLTHWGIDADADKTLSRRASPVDWETLQQRIAKSYPSPMANAGREALLMLRLIISPQGRVTKCFPQMAVGHEDFVDSACAVIMAEAIFSPALNAQGQAVASYYLMSLDYWL